MFPCESPRPRPQPGRRRQFRLRRSIGRWRQKAASWGSCGTLKRIKIPLCPAILFVPFGCSVDFILRPWKVWGFLW